ncbi:MAG: AI-2E family transporter [Verrucomicrobia bacterium]|nr:AI-2E family transporter [Verrucomicrobiota bacterium]
MKTYPTPWQQKILWGTLTAVAIAVIGALSVLLILGVGKVLGFLQPLLIPVAVAGILAFLLNPVVERFVRRGMSPGAAVMAVFASVFLPVALIALWVVPEIYHQSAEFAVKLPEYISNGQKEVMLLIERLVTWFNLRYPENPYMAQVMDWAQKQLPALPLKAWRFISGGVQGFLGAAGFLLGLVLVPIYLYYLLINAESISQSWGNYLPLRASPLRDEVVDCLTEINSYLIAFFRGQILVTIIDGTLIAVGLLALGMKFALLIGLMVAVLQLIPYLGVMLCWIPSVLIAYAQWGDWQHPALVTLIFFVVFQLEGFVVAPKIVGESVGLHPMTIIVSMFAWSLIIGGLLGALLAVPMTATLKVLLRRYVWEKQFERAAPGAEPPIA